MTDNGKFWAQFRPESDLGREYGAGKIAWVPPRVNLSVRAKLEDKSEERKLEAFACITDVEGLHWADGAPVTVEQLKNEPLPLNLGGAIVFAYNAHVKRALAAEYHEKNVELLS